jgi:hypothetical protein
VRSQRSVAEPGISGSTSSSSERNADTVLGAGTRAPSANVRCTPRLASSAATAGSEPVGIRTIRPTSRVFVCTRDSGCTCRIAEATADTSSVDIIHMPAPSKSTSWVVSATARRRHRGIGRTRHGAASTTSAAAASSAAAGRALDACPASAKLARTCARSSLVSLASRTMSSAAIARVFTRAWPTGRP